MRENWGKRITSGLLAGVLVLGYVPATAFAAETDGLCPHHTQHTEACGYSAAVEGHACSHEHTGECYEAVTECAHVHVDCGYVAAVEGHGCECQPNENGEIVHMEGCGYVEAVAEVPCGHVCSEETGCINCQHQHNDSCGFVEEKAELPCTFVCEECAKEANQLLKEAKTDDQTEKFQITFDVSGGTILGECPESYTTGNTIVLPTDVQKAGYRFLGWYIGEQCFAEIAADESGDKTFTAKWEEKATVSIDKTQQTYAYDGTEKSFLLKDVAGNTLEIQSGNWVVPCGFTSILTPYGVNVSPTTGEEVNHQGIDLDTGTGWPVMAARSGKIITATYSSSAGFYVKIDHGDGFTSSYLHLSNFNVAAGQKVKAGQQIGTTGATGVSSGDHLHFGIEYNGTAVNPANYISFDGDAFSVTYAPTEGLSSEGLPVEPGSYDVTIFRGENENYSAFSETIPAGLVITGMINASGTCGPHLNWTLDNEGTLTISGNGEMWDYNGWGTTPWFDVRQDIKALVIKNGVTSIGYGAFDDCQNMEEASLPESLHAIGSYAFSGCWGLKNIIIPDGVSLIGQSAFWSCFALESITLPKMLQSIGDDCFQECSKLQAIDVASDNPCYISIDGVLFKKEPMELICYPAGKLETEYLVPNGVVSINSTAFSNCQYLESLLLPDGLQRIENSAFLNAEKIQIIDIPSTVTNIEESAFRHSKLAQVNVDSENKQYASADGVLFNKSMTELLYYPHEKPETVYIVPDGVAEIHLLAFENNEYLTNITLPSSLSVIGDFAFNQCVNLVGLQIPKSMTRIGICAFQGCESLEEIYFKGNTPQIRRNAFWGVTAKCYYPSTNTTWSGDVFQDYGGELTWLPYELPLEDLDRSGPLGENLTWELSEDGTLTISGLGEMPYYWSHDQYPWDRLRPEIQKVVVGLGVESVGDYAFTKCESLTVVSLPNTLRTIRSNAFHACPELTEITIPKKVYHLSSAAFKFCDKLRTIHLQQQNSNCHIEEDTFSGVTADVYFYGNAWQQSDRKDYGGHLTWIDLREKLERIELESFSTLIAGSGRWCSFEFYPMDAVRDVEFSIEDPEIAQIGQSGDNGCYVKALREGHTVLTIRDRITGISKSVPVDVEKAANVIPSVTDFSDTFLVMPGEDAYHSFARTYSFIPKESGKYKLETTFVDAIISGDVGLAGITVSCDGEFLDLYDFSESTSSVFHVYSLEANKEYIIHLGYLTGEKPEKSTFTLSQFTASEKPEEESIWISSVRSFILFPDNTRIHHLSYSYQGSSPLEWSTDHPEIIQIKEVDQSFVSLLPLKAGTATIFCSGNGISEAIPITVQEASPLRLNESVYMNLQESGINSRGVIFVAPEDGVYYFGTKESSESVDLDWSIGSYYGYQYVTDSFTDSGKITYCTLKKGDTVCITVSARSFAGTFYVKKASTADVSMKLVVRYDYANSLGMGVSYSPASAIYSPIVDWASSDEKICRPQSNYYRGSCSFSVLQEGDVTITATAANGQTASMEVHVGKCLKGHVYGSWEACTSNMWDWENALIRRCVHCGAEEYYLLQDRETYTLNSFEMGLKAGQTLWIDGVPYDVDASGKIDLEGVNANTAVLYNYHTGSSDVHTQYPTGMKVWKLKRTDAGYTAEYVPEFDNLLQYSGSSIRITGNKGIRMITSVNQDTRNALTGNGLANFKLLEYGTLLAQTSKLGDDPLVLGGANVKSNYAYKKGVADPVFRYANGLIQYTNVLVGFTDDQCAEDIAMRPYMKLMDENGEVVAIYGGIVYRSIGYIAYQNRNAFQPGSAAYEYVWSIIHNVYGTAYDAEYRKQGGQ